MAILQGAQRQVEGHCVECDAVLLVDLGAVIAAHGETTTLKEVGYTILCPVCEAAGLFLRELPKLGEPLLNSNVVHITVVVIHRPSANWSDSGWQN